MLSELENFPPIWQKPAFEELLACLASLRVEALAWSARVSRSEAHRVQDAAAQLRRDEVVYLSNVIKSRLEWIRDEDQRDELWTEASRRLSERCGRAAMGEMVRRWPFDGHGCYPSFELVIREPALTGDSLGLKTWGSSYALAQMLHDFSGSSLRHLLSAGRGGGSAVSVLELGSGTGLLGLAAAAIWQTDVVLSDLPTIMPNLVANGDQNRATLESRGGHIRAGALTWGGSTADDIDQKLFSKKNQFKVRNAQGPLGMANGT